MKTPNDPRHLARKIAFGVIYSNETSEQISSQDELDALITAITDNYGIFEYSKATLNQIVMYYKDNRENILSLISNNSGEWDLDKIYKTDLALIILATSEILSKTVPIKVSIDETIELAKEFGQEDSPKFVNGVLAGIINQISNGSDSN